MNPRVDGYLRKVKKWREELGELRKIILDCDLTEDVKWRHPCYTFDGANVLILGSFNDYCVINFVKGALLKDSRKILVKPGENSQSSRTVRFTDVQQIVKLKTVLNAYINEAIAVEKAGLKVTFKKITEFNIPEELQAKFDEVPALKKSFCALTPGRQRAYLLFFSSAKQSKTRTSRIEKCMPQILDGKGLDD